MAPFTFSVVTFGCRVNQADSFACERDLAAMGGTPASAATAELVVVNTCSVTGAADQAARQAIRRLARTNPHARITVTGCYATRKPDDLAALPGVVSVIPNEGKDALARAWGPYGGAKHQPSQGDSAAERQAQQQSIVAERETPQQQGFSPALHPGARGRTVYPLRVQTGCDEDCSYCTIPATRGASRSVPLASVLAEAQALGDAGYREVIVTGVHLGAWGRDLLPRLSLVDLLRALDAVPADALTFRLSSVEPMDCTPSVVRQVAASGRFAPHLHLPLQHASDRLLAAMRRAYSFSDYRAVVEMVRTELPDAAIGADVIVGFPGEDDADQALLERYLPTSGLTHLHVFPYSDRPGTDASTMRGKVSARRMKERAEALRGIARELRAAFERRQVGQVRTALTIEDGSQVATDNYLRVRIPPGRRRNERVRVRIESANPLRGEVVA